ncbi:distal tail protein Dit [Candidatus Contubernalis alkaliaceticus]|uniref:distal tail protein Dit n=1 Tax=Candidatus Contubernalis alkaliaceticus TaxID=338645 RepID=UPI001F4BDEC6|nr:distal tail protein Dit [Candidatus Contubernalis alkalaceticus]UNC91701.1 phage tail family protein [Candidatus Contubernalis alkalaceticus]
MRTVSYNGILNTDPAFGRTVLQSIDRPVSPGGEVRLLYIHGLDGALFQGYDGHPAVVGFEIAVRGKTYEERAGYVRNIASWLDTKQPGPLIFSDEPDKRYMAVLVSEIRMAEIVKHGVMRVLMMDPSRHAVGIQAKTTPRTGVNSGTADTPCIISAQVWDHAYDLDAEVDLDHEVDLDYEFDLDAPVWELFDYLLGVSSQGVLDTASFTATSQAGGFVSIIQDLGAGDSIYIDTSRRLVLVNDVDARPHVTFTSTFFKLPPGGFSITPEPDIVDLSVTFREKFK